MLAKPLTQTAWLLTSDLGHHVAIVWNREDVFVSTHNQEKIYKTLEEIATEFAESLTYKTEEKEEVDNEISGYPIKHEAVFETKDEGYPTYRIKESSSVWFAAGYWVLHNNGTYRVGLSPKVSTLNEGCIGPHKDKFSANVILNNVNKRKNSTGGTDEQI